jgi:hypothetical protein
MLGNWYSQNFSAARQTPPRRSHSIPSLIPGDAAGVDSLDAHPGAARHTVSARQATLVIIVVGALH